MIEKAVLARAMMIGLLVGVALGAIAGWSARGAPVEYVLETPAPSVHFADGTVLAERAPQTKPAFPAPSKPATARVVRTQELTITPSSPPVPTAATPVGCSAETFTCPPVRLRLDVLETVDGFTRVAGKSPDGTITSFVDIPTGKTAVAMRNRLIVFRLTNHDQAGGLYIRDFGRLSFGGGLIPYRDESLPVVAAGWSW